MMGYVLGVKTKPVNTKVDNYTTSP